jgi:alanine racemase
MNRLGLTIADAQAIIPRINAGDHGITLVMSHLVSAELLNNTTNARQLAAFREIASQFSGVPAALSNSSGIFLGPQYQFDMVRPGAALYGVNPTRRPTRLAIVAAGYADGYFRAASANDGTRGAEIVVAGKRCPIAGRVSMDLTAVDITDLEKNAARRGHMVTLIGEGITVDELAHHFGTIGYEVLTSLGRRFARIYKGGEARVEPAAPATETPLAEAAPAAATPPPMPSEATSAGKA